MEAGEFREDHPTPVGAGAELTEIDAGGTLPRTPGQLFRKRFAEDKLALASLVFIVLLILVAIFAPVVVNIVGAPDPDFRDTSALDPLFATPTGPSSRTTSSGSTSSAATSSAAPSTAPGSR